MQSNGEKVLSLTNLTMNYGGKQVLNGIDLEVFQTTIYRLYWTKWCWEKYDG